MEGLFRGCAVALVCTAAWSLTASANLLTYEFNAVVTEVSGPIAVVPGTAFSGQFSYETDGITDNLGSNPNEGLYFNSLGAISFEGTPLLTVTLQQNHIWVRNDVGLDSFSFLGGGFPGADIQLLLLDGTQSVFDSDSIPTSLDLANFSHNSLLWRFRSESGDGIQIRGRLTSLAEVYEQVPEPATLAILGAGLLALGALRRRTL